MSIRKAVITVAGPRERTLPMQRFVDRDGQEKTALAILLEEVLSSGVEQAAVVHTPGDESALRDAAGSHADRLVLIAQHRPTGYGDAVARARDFAAGEPIVHLVGDHLYLARGPRRCATQVMELANEQRCAVCAVQPTREHLLTYYGTVGAKPMAQRPGVFEVEDVLEKPTPTVAEQRLIVPGLRAGHYLCLFGLHVLTPALFDILAEQLRQDPRASLSPALAELTRREKVLALQVEGVRHNLGIPYGLLMAQLALALEGRDREQVLAQLVELLAGR